MRGVAGACAVVIGAVWLLGTSAGGACGAAIVDLDVGDVGDAEDVRPPAEDAAADDAPPNDDACGTVWYLDADRDGHGDPGHSYCGATGPAGYVDNHDDCCDSNRDVHPGQMETFPASFSCDAGTPSFDYDCNGREEPQWTATGGSCSGTLPPCTLREGWEGSSVPACGAPARWVLGCLTGCLADVVNRVQACR